MKQQLLFKFIVLSGTDIGCSLHFTITIGAQVQWRTRLACGMSVCVYMN